MLLAQMTNYEPFSVDPKLDAELIFVLKVEQNGLLCDEQRSAYQHVFTDNSEDDMPRIEVYRSLEKDWLIRISQIATSPICCEMVCASDFTRGALYIDGNCQDVRFCIDNGLMLIYAFRTAPLMTLEMHAAVVVRDVPRFQGSKSSNGSNGYLFLGHSGTGKSTHARQWLAAFDDAWLLNDDNPILRVMDDGQVYVYGSPWSGKTPCYKNVNAIVAGFLQLKQAPHNRIERMNVVDAFASLLPSCSVMKWDRRDYVGVCDTVGKVLERVPVFFLENLPDEDACRLSFTTLSGIK
jgi:hypothetical protein